MRRTLTALLMAPLIVLVAPVALYLLLLTILAAFGVRRRPRRSAPATRFTVLIPAHNEQTVIGRLCASLSELSYPRDLIDVAVVADNCTDATAQIARTWGARVYERHDEEQKGKGYALAWLLDRLAAEGDTTAGAYIVLDADSVVSIDFLSVMNDELQAGATVVQGYYTVLPMAGRPVESLREGALALVHYLRPAAKNAVGASAGLKGNGMCFHRSVIERFGWPSAGLAEDVEFHLMLVSAGYRVAFAPEAVVRGEMPVSLAGSESQNLRWEAGRLTALRRHALPLFGAGLRRRNVAMLDAAVEQSVPPLSAPVLVAGAILAVAAVLRLRWTALAALGLLLSFAAHITAGLALARVPGRVYRAFLHAPLYIAWKCALYAKALLGRYERGWIRTERAEATNLHTVRTPE
jgi:1,2-diacylglycerol 3-beta-glucosyltransferase